MQIIISPAKKMKIETDTFTYKDVPLFLSDTSIIAKKLQSMTEEQLKFLWKTNASLTALNVERLRTLDLEKQLTPALFSYEGLQYQYMAPQVLSQNSLDYLQNHLRILSGFYGILKPFDGITPYRLEMQAKLSLDTSASLYEFWGSRIAEHLTQESDCILNLASKEYSKAIEPHWKRLPTKEHSFVHCVFGELIDGKLVERATMCKMARGAMVRWLSENAITALSEVTEFSDLQFQYNASRSTENSLVFLKTKEDFE